MKKPHILFVYKQFPGPDVGHAGGESLYRLMEGLHRRGFRISLVAKITEEEKAHLSVVKEICENIYTTPHFRSMRGPRLLTIPLSYMALRRKARYAIHTLKPDLVHIETTQTAATLLGLKLPAASYRTQDVNWFLIEQCLTQSKGWRKWYLSVLKFAFRWMESLLCRNFTLILAISKGDQQLLESMVGNRPVLLVPLGTPMLETGLRRTSENPPNLLFVGDMSRKVNIQAISWFLKGSWEHIVSEIPDTRLYIVGRNPPPELKAWADNRHIFVTGFVDELTPWYQKASVFISPLLVAGGLLQKVLDAMWLGVPVVATSLSNHGLGAHPGKDILTADTVSAFANGVVDLLRDPTRARELGEAGQNYVKEKYDLEPALDAWSNSLLTYLDQSE
jgi:glycosyltransferase involved in cell wall biosynthesis